MNVPVIANGDIFSLEDAKKCQILTGVDGVMAARGLLANPALFKGYKEVPDECILDFLNVGVEYAPNFKSFHFLLSSMLFQKHTSSDIQTFNNLTSMESVIQYFRDRNFEI